MSFYIFCIIVFGPRRFASSRGYCVRLPRRVDLMPPGPRSACTCRHHTMEAVSQNGPMQDGLYGQKYLLTWVFLPYIIFKAQGKSLKKKDIVVINYVFCLLSVKTEDTPLLQDRLKYSNRFCIISYFSKEMMHTKAAIYFPCGIDKVIQVKN